jgi:sRNA-binding regulator protein Hfq
MSGDAKNIRGDLLSWLCTNPQATAQLTYRGISITGAEFVEEVDLTWTKISFPIMAFNCVFSETINLSNSQLALLFLEGSSLKDLNANSTHFEGSVFLSYGFKAEGGVDFTNAKIDVNLECSSGQFVGNDRVPALNANSAEVKGSVFLNNGFKAEGGVDFANAKIDRNLDCDSGQFLGTNKVVALNANAAEVKGSVFLNNGFKAEGGVDFGTAKIDGNLECDSCQFLGTNKVVALNANDAEVKGSVFLRNGFKAEGGVDFRTAKIDGNLECNSGQFVGNDNVPALNADAAEVKGSVFLRNGFKAEGGVIFFGAYVGRAFQWFEVKSPEKAILDLRLIKIGTLLNRDSWPIQGNLRVDGSIYDQIDDSAPPSALVQLGWLGQQPRDRFRSQPFEQLFGVLRKMGLEEDARIVMIAKNQEHARYVQWRPEWLWYGFFGQLIGYGYSPWRAFGISLIVILIGWAVFRRGYYRGLITPRGGTEYTMENGEAEPVSKDIPKFNAFVYSLETFVPLVKFGIADCWEPNGKRDAFFVEKSFLMTGGCLRGYMWFHMIAGWVLTALWVGGITGLVKT